MAPTFRIGCESVTVVKHVNVINSEKKERMKKK